MSGPAPSWLVRAILVLAIALLAVVAVDRLHESIVFNTTSDHGDFQTFYRTARCLFVERCDPYRDIAGIPPNLDPPHAHVLLMPWALWPTLQAYWMWMAISGVGLIATAFRLRQTVSLQIGLLPSLALVAAVAGSSIAVASVSSGQIYAALAWPVTEVWLALRSRKMARGAILLGLAASVKPTLLLPMAWLAMRGHWRAAAIAVAACALAFAIGLWGFGWSAYAGWLDTVAHFPREGHFADGSILETLLRAFTPTGYLAQVSNLPGLVLPLWAALSGFFISITLLRPLDADRTWLALLACANLVAPKGWIYGGWWLLFPAIVVWRFSASPWTRGLLVCAGALVWLPDTAPMWAQPNPALTLTWGSLYFWVWLMVWVACQLPGSMRARA